ncbi:MAG: glycoside hydrolase family 9 protein [Halobacteriaceae archaeon]
MDEPLSRDAPVEVAVNHVGYLSGGAKRCVAPGSDPTAFEVRRLPGNEPVHEGTMRPAGGDFGDHVVGAFDAVRTPGTYYVRTDGARSYPFRVGPDAYDDFLVAVVDHFGAQRCGPSETGYLSPCHCDDGVRDDTGERQDVTGGWHDATDLRKWVGATVRAMTGLSALLDVGVPVPRARLLDELRWGNRYFLAMQEPEGYLMSHVGGDLLEHGDSNRWTDNEPGDGGEVRLVDATGEGGDAVAAVAGDDDDRVIDTDPVGAAAQFAFVEAEATLARHLDGEESERCLDAAERCFAWATDEGVAATAGDLGQRVRAGVALHRATGDDAHREAAADAADRLLDLQVTDGDPAGFFRTSATDDDPYRDVWELPPALGLADLASAVPDHPDAGDWRAGVNANVRAYLLSLAGENAFGTVPLGLFSEAPGGDRRVGAYWYRYFMRPEGWWVGVNATLAGAGVLFARAADLLDDGDLVAAAQRQFDWVLGANPLGASTVEGFGHGHPERFRTGEFHPQTPRIRGAVMNGLGGTEADDPARWDGAYHTAEYWTPMCAYALWLGAELRGR